MRTVMFIVAILVPPTLSNAAFAAPAESVRAKPPCVDVRTGAPKCKPGFVPRLAGPSDFVCVHPDFQQRAALDNRDAASNVDPNGAYGPDSCKPGLVWREAFPGDRVCVTPEIRIVTRGQNRNATNNRACNGNP